MNDSKELVKELLKEFRVALVFMPFGEVFRPSIQIGLLQALAEQSGFPTDSYHLNLDLAAHLTLDIYNHLCQPQLLGEWLFAVAAFPETLADDEAFFLVMPEEATWAEKIGKDYLSKLRYEIFPQFIQDCLNRVNWGLYQAIGFSSTYQQNVASLALARRIKESYPEVKIIFGGANMKDDMGIEQLRAFPFIDYVVTGEGDLTFPALLHCLALNQEPLEVPGLAWRGGEGLKSNDLATPNVELDLLPTPNYDDYFQRGQRLGLLQQADYLWSIPFESSRGCWWGKKCQCTFCGLNGANLNFRAKSPERVLGELTEQAYKYRRTMFTATDNILDMTYIDNFFPFIQESKTDYQFFYELKSNLNRQQLQTLHQGGVRLLQPGIESLSTHVLKLMRKGSTMLHNIRMLKWSRYYKMSVGWNLLWGFPGETAEDYQQELQVLQLISHLEPPFTCSRISLMRFSPYYSESQSFPLRQVRPRAGYRFIYPENLRLDLAVNFFDCSMENTLPDEAHYQTMAWVKEWQDRWSSEQPDFLYYRRTLDSLFIDDNRGSERRGSHAFYGPMALIYEFCSDTMRTVRQVGENLRTSVPGYHYSDEEVHWALEEFSRLGLMLGESGQYLSLALPLNPNW